MNEIKTATIGKGKAVHALFGTDRTLCKRNSNADSALPVECDADEVTCKKCLKDIAALVEQAHTDALRENRVRVAQREASFVEDVEDAHAQAIEENAERYGTHLVKWLGADGESRYCDVLVPLIGVPWRDQHHEGPCYDAVKGEWREERQPTPQQRKADRRHQRVTLRRMTPQLRAAGRARRAQRGAARATAKTLLVASGVPQDIADRYASSFSRGVQAVTAVSRIRIGEHRSKRVAVKRYSWSEFTARLEAFRPACTDPFGPIAAEFRAARERVLA